MTQARQLEMVWQDDHRRLRARLLAVMYLSGGLLCLLAAWISETPGAPYALVASMGGASLLVVVLLAGLDAGTPIWLLHLLVAAFSVLVGVLAGISVSGADVVGLGPPMIGAAMFNAYFCTRRSLWAQIGLGVGAFVIGSTLSGARGVAIPVLTASVVGVAVAISLRHLAGQLRHRIVTDPLTGLINRATWLQVARRELNSADLGPVSIALLDLDHFKGVNDELGHFAGDDLLRAACQSWMAVLGEDALLGRFGGDEFVVLLPGVGKEAAEDVVRRLRDAHPALWTCGIAEAKPAEKLTDLLERADQQLLSAKRSRHAP